MWRRPARMRGWPIKPHTSARRAPRRRVNGCADVRFLTCAAVQPLVLRPQVALGSGFSLQAAFWYQNAMLARVVADCAASRRLFMLRIKKSSLIRFVAPPFQNANSSLVCILVFFFSRYISRYVNLKFGFLPFVVATIVAMVFFSPYLQLAPRRWGTAQTELGSSDRKSVGRERV